MSFTTRWLAPAAALLLAAGCADSSAPTGLAPEPSLLDGIVVVDGTPISAAPAAARSLQATDAPLAALTSSPAITTFATRAEFNGRTVQRTETFASFGGVSKALPNPYTASGVSYTTGKNVLINTDMSFLFGNVQPVVCYDTKLTPMRGLVGTATTHYSLFGFDLSVLVKQGPVTIALTTNKGSYSYPGVTVTDAAHPGFFGFATVDPDEWFTGFTITSSVGGAPCLGNVSVGSAVPLDNTAPVIVPTVTGTLGTDGWYVSPASLTWSVTDPESAVTGATGCDALTVSASQSETTYTCSATSLGGTASVSTTIKADLEPPVVAWSGNAGAYTVADMVDIGCSATDATSGVATSTCRTVSGAAYTFGTGSHTLSAAATDRAGNASGPVTTIFTVTATPASLCTLVTRWTNKEAIARNLCGKLDRREWAAFRSELSAQRGKSISSANADVLLGLVRGM